MKYNSLKRQPVNFLKVNSFDGGIDLQNPPTDIPNNNLCSCSNMWFKNSRLQTRPGFKGDSKRAVEIELAGNGEPKYKMTDCVVYYDDYYHRIATSEVLIDDSSYNICVYLVDLYNNITPIGNMSFLRLTSDIFYTPISVLFYTGKSDTGGGVFAFVTLQNQGVSNQRYYHIYEISEDYSEWNRVLDYYVPTIYINGRGNKYDTARSESSFTTPAPMILESQNMLNGRFSAYYTSDGYSTSFRLPFANLSSETVVCRIYYTLKDYTEWKIDSSSTENTQKFSGANVTAVVDRQKGTVYFTKDSSDYAVPVMSAYHQNNIKITATKEIENGFQKIVHSSCCVRHNSKLLLSGGESGNTVFVTSYDNPLYFPQNSCAVVGDSDTAITALSVQQGKIIAFKPYELYAITFKSGENINEISLLSDNDTFFKKADSMSVTQISYNIGCENNKTIALCGDINYWLGADNNIYALDSVSPMGVKNLSMCIKSAIPKYDINHTFGIGNADNYFLFNGQEVVVVEINNKSLYLWTLPDFLKVDCGFYTDGKFKFICKSQDGSLTFMTTLDGYMDSCITYGENGDITELLMPINCNMTTKHFKLSKMGEYANIDNLYLSLWAIGKVEIIVNGKQSANISLGFSNKEYIDGEHKSVKLIPHIYGVDSVYLTVSCANRMSIGETEIYYRITG